MELAVLRGSDGGAYQSFAGLLHADDALGGLVLDLQRGSLAGLDDNGVDHAVDHIGSNGGQLLHVVGAAVHVIQQNGAVRSGGDFGDLGGAGSVRIDTELYPGKRRIIVAVLLDLQFARSGGVDAEGGAGHDLRSVCAQKDLLKAVLGGDVRCHVL